MLSLKSSLKLLLLIFNMARYKGEKSEELDYINDNVIIRLENVPEEEIEELINETENLESPISIVDDDAAIARSDSIENVTDDTKMQGKIVGGEYANIQDFPHSVFMMAYCNTRDKSDYWMCGGSVVNQRIVLTAAHCVYGCGRSFKIDVLAGSSNYERAQVLKQVRSLAYHAKYDDDGVFADIGLLYLNGNLPFGKAIQRVLLRPSFPDLTDGRVAGWGIIDEQGTMTTRLKVVRQKIWALSACEKYESLVRGTFCASSGSSKQYALSGDSGSALIVPNLQQLGLVSYRDDRYPELIVYTNVSYYYKWIQEMAQKLYCHHSKVI